MLSERLEKQLKALKSVKAKGGVISDIDGYRQTVEDPTSLTPDPNNANIHTPENLAAIGYSLNQFGFRKNAIAVQEGSRIIYAGNGIVQWCVENEIPVCPVVWIPESMTASEAAAFALADNQAPRLAEFDFSQLQETLDGLPDDISAEGLGFDEETINELFEDLDFVDDAVDAEGSGASRDATNPSQLIKLLFTPAEVAIVEKALLAVNKPSRGESLTEICRAYLKGVSDAEK